MSRQAAPATHPFSRLYALVLRAFLPAELCRAYGRQMHETFAQLRHDARARAGWSGELAVWWREVTQLWRVGRHERRNERKPAPGGSSGGFRGFSFNVRLGLRGLRRSPGMSLTVIVTLALGIGANATMFSVIDRVLLQPPGHIEEPDDVVRMYVQRHFIEGPIVTPSVTYPDFADFATARHFASTAAYGAARYTVGHGEGAQRVRAVLATPSLFPLLGVQPFMGRFYSNEEDAGGEAVVAVLSYELWRRDGADPDVLGSEIRLGGVPHTVVGVAPQGFTGVDLQPVDVWLPLHSPANAPAEQWENSRGYYWLRSIARLAPDATLESAGAEATALHRGGRDGDEYYDPEATVVLGSLIEARGVRRSNEAVLAHWLSGVSVVVLLVACANVANMLLARGVRRRREVGVCLALGVSRGRLIAQQLTESVLLALAGGAGALAVAYWGALTVRSVLLPNIYWPETPLNGRVLLFTFAAALVSGALAGIIPALQATRQHVVDVLRGTSAGSGRATTRARVLLLVGQAALSVVLLVGAGLFVKSIQQVYAMDLGYEPDRLLVAMPEIDEELLTGEGVAPLFDQALGRIRALPAVENAAASAALPFYWSLSTSFVVPGREELPRFSDGGPYIHAVSHEYLTTTGIRVLRGRGFTEDDDAGAQRVVIVDENMADAYWPGQDPLGECVHIDEDEGCTFIIGIAEASARESLEPTVSGQYYVPVAQWPEAMEPHFVVVRAAPDRLEELMPVIQREVQAVSPAVRFVDVRAFRGLIDPQSRTWKLGATLFSAFGALALVIAAVGLYGVLSFEVQQRRHEIGVRSALGASARGLVVLVAWQAGRMVVAGLLFGLLVALAAGPYVQPLLFQVDARDPSVLLSVAALLAAVAVVAATLPALRAARVHPVVALRQD